MFNLSGYKWIALVAFLLAGCNSMLEEPSSGLLDSKLERKSSPYQTNNKKAQLQKLLAEEAADEQETFEGYTQLGDDQLTGQPVSKSAVFAGNEASDIKINLVDVPINEVAKSVLGDILNLNYSLDPQVAGNVTLQTSKPVSRRKLVAMFENVLRDVDAAIVDNGDSYRIVPIAAAARSTGAIETGRGKKSRLGVRPTLIPLENIGAEEMRSLLEPILPEGTLLKADTRRNALIVVGNASEIAAIRESISVFDVDWMKGMSVALVPVRSSRPDAVVADLEQIYQTKSGPLKNILRFVPNKRLKSVLVISSRAKYLSEAKGWITKLDVLAETSEETLHVYRVQNRTATELAKVLQSVLKSDVRTVARSPRQPKGEVAPKFEAVETLAPGEPLGPTEGPETPATGLGSNSTSDLGAAEQIPEPLEQGDVFGEENEGSQRPAARVVADDANNSLLIFASRDEFERILSVLEEIDAVPNQVLLEAVIAEVTLGDDLRFGVRALIGDAQDSNGTFSDLATGAVAQAFPGFSYFLKANDISFSLNALSSVTDVRVLSSPSLVVLDNKKATLQVGDQVPIVTQSTQSKGADGAPIINNVELKDTGVILNVTPRVNESGQVTLDIEQEVSAVVKTTTSGIDSPTIRQRKIKTSVVISDGEALALGGLIQENEQTNKTKTPVLGDIPILGNAFRQKSNNIGRTELIIFIRPRVIRDMNEARRITREFRKEIGVRAPRVRKHEPTPGEELIRILR
jgi:general secretion pathway protein D